MATAGRPEDLQERAALGGEPGWVGGARAPGVSATHRIGKPEAKFLLIMSVEEYEEDIICC